MLEATAIDAVVFDIGGVFLVPDPAMLHPVWDVIGHEHVDDHDRTVEAHYRGVRAITEWIATTTVDNPERDPRLWRAYDLAYFATFGLEIDACVQASDVRADLRRVAAPGIWSYPLRDNIAAVAVLATRFALAVVTNNDGTAPEQCVEHGIGQVGDGPLPELAAVVDSTLVGLLKPDPAIFTPALEALGVSAHRALYVGDTVHADVHGARAAGMQVVQLDPHDLHADHDHPRVADLPALAALLV
jgi:FMN phosphatase YigB (HAD superfamily)